MEEKDCKLTTSLSLDRVFRHLPGVIFWQDLNLIINGCNDSAVKLFGFRTTEEMIGKTPLDFQCKAAESAPEFMKLDTKAIQARQEIRALIIDTFSNNEIAGHFVKKIPIFEHGTVVGVLTQGSPINSQDRLLEMGIHLAKLDVKNRKSRNYCYTIKNKMSDFDLSEKETVCLFYFIRGKTVREISDILFLSPSTIEFHLNNIKEKMNCRKKAVLIEKAIENGYMNFIPKSLLSSRLILLL